MRAVEALLAASLLATAMLAQDAPSFSGTVCRLNRSVDRMILATEDKRRLHVIIPDDAVVTFERRVYRVGDLRPGAQVIVRGSRTADRIDASEIDVQYKVSDAVFNTLLPKKKIVTGRFGVREAKTDSFSLSTGDGNYVRVDAKSAYGPHGRVRVGDLRSGDLLELNGEWKSRDLLHATYINVITNDEPPTCRADARRGETNEQTTAREAAEQKFLDSTN